MVRIIAAVIGFGLIFLFGVSLFAALWEEFRNPVRGSGKRIYPLSLWMGKGEE